MQLIAKNDQTKFLYLGIYEHYKEQILTHRLTEGTRMPSLRQCSRELGLSRTTVEAAYLQLAADGYILSRPSSGYFVTDIAGRRELPAASPQPAQTKALRYDLSTEGTDPKAFRMELWSRYVKSALRQKERLLYYGEPQGEADLREALCGYIRRRRNILCSPEEIVVGAGMQNLFQILCPLLKDRHTVSFPTGDFLHGISVFQDYGFDVHIRDKDCSILCVSPARMTHWGDVMPMSRRMELMTLAREQNRLILEDDFENEFVYASRPTPSLFALDGGSHTVYLGSFSRLLLPSIRLAFMILPPTLLERYRERMPFLHQTASKAEQIALAQFIRDGHLETQLGRARRLYRQKASVLREAVQREFSELGQVQGGLSGISLALTVPTVPDQPRFLRKAQSRGLAFTLLRADQKTMTLLLSCAAIPVEEIEPACRLLKELLLEALSEG